MTREVWAEFGDGSVAKYDIRDEDLPEFADRFRNSGLSCKLWLDGKIWMKCGRFETSDDPDPSARIGD